MDQLVDNSVLALIAGVMYLLCSLIVLFENRRNGFLYLLIYSEYFYIVGIGLGSIFLAFGIGSSHEIFKNYIAMNGRIVDYTFIHIIAFSIGMVCGVLAIKLFKSRKLCKIDKINQYKYDAKGVFFYRFLIYLGLGALLIYVILVGPVTAFVTAAAARAGSQEGLEDAMGFVFLKNLAQIGAFSLIFFPLIINKKNNTFDISLLIIYGFLLYSLTGARAALTDTLALAVLIWFSVSSVCFAKKFFVVIVIGTLGALFVFYGKGLSEVLFIYLFSGEMVGERIPEGSLSSFVDQFVHLVYSIDAGLKYFDVNGPTFSKALFLSPLGVFPGWFFTETGMEFLSWQHVRLDENIVCLNSMAFNASPCTMPPYYIGFSAYLAPIVGGFLFGFLKFFIYQLISRLWTKNKSEPVNLWLPILLFILWSRGTTMIPNVIGLFSFFSLVSISFYIVYRFLVMTSRRNV